MKLTPEEAAGMRRHAQACVADAFESAAQNRRDRIRSAQRFDPVPVELVRVVALEASWCVGGKPIVVGTVHNIEIGTAAELVRRGKAKFA